MRKSALVLLLALIGLTSCATATTKRVVPAGQTISKEYSVGNFNGISSASAIRVFVEQGPEYRVEVRADINIMPEVDVRVSGGNLKIGYKNVSINGNVRTEVYVTAPDIKSLTASSASEIIVRGTISTSSMKVDVSSAAQVSGKIMANKISVSGSSSGQVRLSGSADVGNADASSAASIRMEDMQCGSFTAKASSAASIHVRVSDHLTAKASSGSKITYRGNPTLNVSKSSGASVRKR